MPDDAKPKLEELTGTVQHLNCAKPTFSAGRISVDGKIVSFSVKGFARSGDCVTLVGSYENHEKWGLQFKATSLSVALPTDADGLVRWLQWNVLKVGPVTAQRMVDEFGVALMDRCGSDPESVAIFAKLPLETIEDIATKWQADRNRIGAMTFLAGLGLTQRQCEAVISKFGGSAVALIQQDPYQLIGRVEGFGWVITDALAKQLDICGDDPRRLRGALNAMVRERYDQGSTCINVNAACHLAAEKLSMRDRAPIIGVVDELVDNGDLRRFGGGTEENDFLATPFAYTCEEYIWKTLARSRDPNPHFNGDEQAARDLAEQYRTLGTMTFEDAQIDAIRHAIQYRISVVTGSAGSGKTQIIKQITKLFQDGDTPVRLAAPTGKAARRMREVVGTDAETIHRLLEFNGGTGHFTRDAKNPLTDCVIVCDEFSMCDSDLMYRLLSALGPGTSLVLVGDPNQLPPVGPGSPLRDMLQFDLAPAVRLEKVHRQAGALKANSVAILSGRVAPTVTDEDPSPWCVNTKIETPVQAAAAVRKLYEKYLPEWGFHPVSDTQFMSAKYDGGFGIRRFNLLLQWLHQNALGNAIPEPAPDAHEEKSVFYPGDKVIETKNNYNIGVMNGESGILIACDPTLEDMRLFSPNGALPMEASTDLRSVRVGARKPVADYVVDFPDRRVIYPVGTGGGLNLGYCISVHRAQGSQWPCAVIFMPKTHSFMTNRSLLYTAVTRAQRTAIVVGDTEGIRRAAEKVVVEKRVTIMTVFATCQESAP